jgi:hypothetical protein
LGRICQFGQYIGGVNQIDVVDGLGVPHGFGGSVHKVLMIKGM